MRKCLLLPPEFIYLNLKCTHCKKYFSDKISQTSHRMFIDFAENYLLGFYLSGESSKPKKKLVSPCILLISDILRLMFLLKLWLLSLPIYLLYTF